MSDTPQSPRQQTAIIITAIIIEHGLLHLFLMLLHFFFFTIRHTHASVLLGRGHNRGHANRRLLFHFFPIAMLLLLPSLTFRHPAEVRRNEEEAEARGMEGI
jgi:hypothetical protein